MARSSGTGGIVPRDLAARLWRKDVSLFTANPAKREAVAGRLGWLDAPGRTLSQAGEIETFARECAARGLREAVILGMGGSSLCPLVLSLVLPPRPGFLRLRVMDTTSPQTVAGLLRDLDPAATLFVVSSKSGTTVEPQALFLIIREFLRGKVAQPGRHFAAITDPGTPLERLAREDGFCRVFTAPTDVGGRFSALTAFGMVPAALMGADIRELLTRAEAMAGRCREEHEEANPGLALGVWMAARAASGRDKLTLAVSPGLASLALWLEQLLAESTGKAGRGIIPVAGEAPGGADAFGPDRCLVRIALAGDPPDGWNIEALEAAGLPVFSLEVPSALDIGAEFLRWEVATALAGCLLEINPFDEPNVAESKRNTLDILERFRADGSFPRETDGVPGDGLMLYPPAGSADPGATPSEVLGRFLRAGKPGDYLAILAYLPYDDRVDAGVGELREMVRRETGMATTFGYGPRYLHSTGQIHKGGPATGIFLLLTGPEGDRLPVPDAFYTLGELHLAQALGDERALRSRGRPVLRIHLEQGASRAADLLRLLGR